MKYHTPIRIVVISLITALLFSLASLAAVYLFSSISPAEIALESILNRIEVEGTFNISFSSMQKNVRGHLTLNGIRIEYGEDTLMESESVTLSQSFIPFVRSLLFKSGRFDVSFSSTSVNIPEESLESLKKLFSAGADNVERGKSGKPSDYSFHLTFDDIDASVGNIRINNAKLYLEASTINMLEKADVSIEDSHLIINGISIGANGIGASINHAGKMYSASFSLDSLNLSNEDDSIDAQGISGTLSTSELMDFSSYSFHLGVSGAELSVSDIFFSRFYPLSIDLRENMADLSVSLIVASYGSYATSIRDFSASYDLSEKDGSMTVSDIVLFDGTDPKAEISGIGIQASLTGKEADLSIDSIGTSLVSAYTKEILKSASMSSISAKLLFSDGYDLSLTSEIGLESGEEIFNGTSAGLSLNIIYDGKKIGYADAQLMDIKLPMLDDTFDASFSYDGKKADLGISYSDSFTLDASYDGDIKANAGISELSLSGFSPYIKKYVPLIENYISESTVLNGSFSIGLENDSSSRFGYRGGMDYSLTLRSISFASFSFDASSEADIAIDDEIGIRNFSIMTDFASLSFNGKLSPDNLLPSGNLRVENPSSGREYLTLDLDLNSSREYSFALSIPPAGTLSLEGFFNFEDEDHLFSDANLFTSTTGYEFLVDLNFHDQEISITNDNAVFFLSYGDVIESYIEFDNFELPHPLERESGASVNGRTDFFFDVSDQIISASSSSMVISNLYILSGSPSLSFSVNMDNTAIRLNDIMVLSDDYPSLEGSLAFYFEGTSFAFFAGNAEEEIALSITPYENYLTGYFRLKDFDARRIGLGNNLINADLLGRGQDFDSLAFSGMVTFDTDDPSNPMSARGEISINSKEISITDFSYETPSLEMRVSRSTFSSGSGTLFIPFDLRYAIANKDRDYPIELSLEASMNLGPSDNLYTLVRRLMSNGLGDISGRIGLVNLAVDTQVTANPVESTFTYRGDNILFDGSFVSGIFNIPSMYFSLKADLGELGRYDVSGSLQDEWEIDASIRGLSLYSTNIFYTMPVIIFSEDSLANGDLKVIGRPGDIHLYGSLWSDMIDMEIFWLPGQHVVAHNIVFTVWDNSIESSPAGISVINSEGERKEARGRVCFYLSDQMGFDRYTVDVNIDEGNEIDFRLPMSSMNVDIVGKVSGHFFLNQRGLESVAMTGEMNIYDTELSLGMYPLPEWFNSGIETSYDFSLNLVSNNSFIFPLGANPIISASAAENQFLRFYTNESGGYGASGAIELRAGEIYYFQRSFFIREGNINFRDNGLNSLDPVINLRAELRAFDSDGDPVDIFLVLREADLNNFTPTFESSPAKDLSEIMSILGQAIVNSDGSATNLGNVVSILTTGVDVLQRMGLIRQQNDGSLQMSIRNSLNLDTFALHTNIIGNLVYDAVLSGQNAARWNISPLARYLDGTALYIGKYITPDIYFEALAHLSAQRRAGEDAGYENISSFLSSDLFLDVELSLEWENPLCTATLFTRPQSLTIDSCFRYIGLTLSKRFVF